MKNKIITILIFATVVFSGFYFGFSRLSNFSGVDEPYWSYERVPDFWNAIKKMQWKKTNLCDKPGITIAAVSGMGLPFVDGSPKELKKLRYEPKTPEQLNQIKDLYFYLRLPVFLFTLAILPLLYFMIKKLLGRNTARFAIIFIGFSPILLGISLIINADAMLWIMTALSTLSLFVFLKDNQRKFLLLSGFFLGLSVIDKYVANVLFVYFFLIFLLEYLLHAHKEIEIGHYLKKSFFNYSILFATAIATAFVFFPATWVKFSALINATIGNEVFSSTWPLFVGIIGLLAADIFAFKTKFSKIIFGFFTKYRNILIKTSAAIFLTSIAVTFLHVYAKVNFFDIYGLVSSPKGIGSGNIAYKYSGAVLADIYSLIFSISPLVLCSILFAVYSLLSKKEISRKSITATYIIIFILIFYLGNAVNDVIATVRYQIMVYPLAFVLAATGMSWFLEIEKIKKYLFLPIAYAITILILFAGLFFTKPNFLAYASEILPNNFIVNLKGMGEGSYEAANYLNSLPNAQKMIIWADKGAVCERFVGKCFIDFKKTTFADNKIDYFVLSTDRMSRTVKLSKGIKIIDEEKKRAKEDIQDYADFEKLYANDAPVFEIIINNNPNNFVKVIKTESIF